MLQKLNQLHPKVRLYAIRAYDNAVRRTPVGVHPVITETYRSFDEQDELYLQGRTRPGSIVTYAKGGQSYHNYGLALDFGILVLNKPVWKVDVNWLTVVKCFREQGFECGIDWIGEKKDPPHFQMTFDYNWRYLKRLYDSKKFIGKTTFVKII